MNPPKTPKMEDRIHDDEISLSRSELYALLQVEKRHVANLEETYATLLKENYDLKANNAELSQKIEIIKDGIGEVVSKAIGDIASGVTSLKAMAYDVGKSLDVNRRSRDCNPDATFMFDATIHDCTRKIPPATPLNTPVLIVPPAMRAPVHDSESIRRAHAKVLFETSPHAKATVSSPVPEPTKTITQPSIIDVTKESPVEEELPVIPKETAAVVEEVIKTPVRTTRQANPIVRTTAHPIAMKGARNTSVDNIMKRKITATTEMTAPPKMTRVETSKPTIQTRGAAIIRKPVAVVTGEGNSRDKMDPALASSTANVTRRVGQHTSSSMAKVDAPKKTAAKRVVRGARESGF